MSKSTSTESKRYCEIRCKSLEDIRDTCRRHIKNTQLMLLGCIDADDLTDTDAFYLDMQERMWHDLLEDVTTMLKEQDWCAKITST